MTGGLQIWGATAMANNRHSHFTTKVEEKRVTFVKLPGLKEEVIPRCKNKGHYYSHIILNHPNEKQHKTNRERQTQITLKCPGIFLKCICKVITNNGSLKLNAFFIANMHLPMMY